MVRLLLLTAQRTAAPRDEDGEAWEDEDDRETTTLVAPSLSRLRVCAVPAFIFPLFWTDQSTHKKKWARSRFLRAAAPLGLPKDRAGDFKFITSFTEKSELPRSGWSRARATTDDAMSNWFASIQDGLRNAETLLNAVDQKAKEVVHTHTGQSSETTPNFDNGDQGQLGGTLSRYDEPRGATGGAPAAVAEVPSGGAGAPSPSAQRSWGAAGQGNGTPTRALPSPAGHRFQASSRTATTASGYQSPSSTVGRSKQAPALTFEEESFDDLTSVLNSSNDAKKDKRQTRTPIKDPRLASPRPPATTTTTAASPLPSPPPPAKDKTVAREPAQKKPQPKPAVAAEQKREEASVPKPTTSAFPSPPPPQQPAPPPQEPAAPSGKSAPDEVDAAPPPKPESNPTPSREAGEPSPKSAEATANGKKEPVSATPDDAKGGVAPGAVEAKPGPPSSTSSAAPTEIPPENQEAKAPSAQPPAEKKSNPVLETASDARAEMRKKLEKEIKEAKSIAAQGNGSSGSGASSGSTSQKEARLSATCERLSSRLQQYKIENEQLEEMLKDMEREKESAERAVGAMADHKRAILAKEAEVEDLRAQLSAAAKANQSDREEILSLRGEKSELAQKISKSEIRVLSAAREEVGEAERRFEAEREAHKATKEAALKREQDLETLAAENATALATMQQRLEERSERVSFLEEANASLEQEYSNLAKEVSDKERTHKHLIASKEDKELKLQELKREMEGLGKFREDLGKAKRNLEAERAAHETTKAAALRKEQDLEALASENATALANMQQRLDVLASDKAAMNLSLEKLKQKKQETKMRARRSPSYDIEGVVPIESMGPVYDRLAKNRRVGKVVQALEQSSSTVVRLLRQQPVVRIGLFVYIICVHFYLYWVLYRLQTKALHMTSAEEEIRSHEG